MKDVSGKTIEVGNLIVFAVVHNRTARLRWGVVSKIHKDKVSTVAFSLDMNFNYIQTETGWKRVDITSKVVRFASAFNYPELKSRVLNSVDEIPEAILVEMRKEFNV